MLRKRKVGPCQAGRLDRKKRRIATRGEKSQLFHSRRQTMNEGSEAKKLRKGRTWTQEIKKYPNRQNPLNERGNETEGEGKETGEGAWTMSNGESRDCIRKRRNG